MQTGGAGFRPAYAKGCPGMSMDLKALFARDGASFSRTSFPSMDCEDVDWMHPSTAAALLISTEEPSTGVVEVEVSTVPP